MTRYERDPQSYDGRSLLWSARHAPKRSLSAETVAVLRAAHQTLDQPVIHADPLAFRIIGPQARTWLEKNLPVQDIAWVRAARLMLATRSRLCEEELQRLVERGTTQYVVLGAGLDTSAYRLTELAARVTIFEVDEPATQAWKVERLQEAGIPVPENLRFVPVDFKEGTLAGELAAAGFDRTRPAFFSWLGVSYYLPLDAILDLMRFIARHEAPAEVIFDIAMEEGAVTPDAREHYRYFRGEMAKTAEPWRTWLDPHPFRETLLGVGFTDVEMIDSNKAVHRYAPSSSYPYPSMMAFVVAKKD